MTKISYNSFTEYSKTKKSLRLLNKRYRREKLFRVAGISAILISMAFLSVLILNVLIKSKGAFFNSSINETIYLDPSFLEEGASYRKFFSNHLKNKYPEITKNRRLKSKVQRFYSRGVPTIIKEKVAKNRNLIGKEIKIWLPLSGNVDQYLKGNVENIDDTYLDIIAKEQDNIKVKFSLMFFLNGDSTHSELAGIASAIVGSLFTMFVFLLISFPLAVLLALYLEEFSAKNKFTDFIEININNLAAIPSIIFGLLGLAVFINLFGIPRSSSFIGGLTLSLMVLPTIVIATRNAIKTVPNNIKDAALALGSSKIQVAMHHTIPLSLPGILTGTILAVSRAMGETAPLLMIGMIAFIVDVPSSLTSPTTVLPVQIYLWSNNPQIGFVEKTSATILVLLVFLVLFNALAIYLRDKFSKRW